MLSKWYPWDFFKNHLDLFHLNRKGLHALEVFDPYLEKMVTFRLKSQGMRFKVLMGSELSEEWLIQKLQELDLFSFDSAGQQDQTSYWLVLNSDQIPKSTQQLILEKKIDFSSHFLLMSFTKKNQFFDELSKSNYFQCCKMEEPRFWEMSKYLDFLSEQVGINLDSATHQYILDSVTHSTQDLIQALSQLKRHVHYFSGVEKGVELVKKILSKSRVDQFSLSSTFSQKNKRLFYQSLLEMEVDFDSLRGLFRFMQGHLLKLYDPSFMEKKSRLSKYDREVAAQSKLWNKADLIDTIAQFSKFEILAKQSNAQLMVQLKLELYKTF